MTALSIRGVREFWRGELFPVFLVFGWIFLLYRKTLASMVDMWARSETYAHGFLVFPIVLWLIWRDRERWGTAERDAGKTALLILVPLGIGWFLGELAAVNVLGQAALVGLLAFSVPALLGWKVARQLAFPLGFLLFAVPAGEALVPPMMDWTAGFTILGLRLSGLPVYQEGLDFVIPSGHWSVEAACSGIRYLIAAVMAGTLFAYLNFHSLRRRLLFIGVSILVPVLANWIRAYLIVMVGHLSGNELATGVDHLIYGWLFFGLVIGAMFLVGAKWSDSEPAAIGVAAPVSQAGTPACPSPQWGRAGLVALVASLPVLGANGLDKLNRGGPVTLEKDGWQFAGRGWQAVPGAPSDWEPGFRDAGDAWRQVFEKEGQTVGLYVAYYRNQDYVRKLVSSANRLVRADDRNWTMAPGGSRRVDMEGQTLAVNVAEVKPRASRDPAAGLVAWQWYWVAGRATASAHQAKAYAAWSRLLGRGDDSAVVILYAPAGQGGEAALAAFSRSAGQAIGQILSATWSRR